MRSSALSLAAVTAILMLSATGLAACGDRSVSPEAAPRNVEAATAVDPGVAMPEDAPPQEEAMAEAPAETATPVSCLAEAGAAASARLVERCIAVSPATHPPCNAQNDCATIQGEIDRSCAMYGAGETKPAECAA
ncbi:hypothetical protein [Brevundimonas sp.]|uniref:hypothetical protein n=1 Tax=Brevundimonas sp. TaxID=1871086 RepID=UPI003BA87E04